MPLISRASRIGLAAFSLLPALAFAQSSEKRLDETAALRAVDAVVSEHRLYATCLALDGSSHALVNDMWNKEVAQAMDWLKPFKPSLVFLAKFRGKVEPSSLLDRDMALSAAMDLCHKSGKLVSRFYAFEWTPLWRALERSQTRPQ
jgi:hypothetical protein